mmetsp:Transcript_36603/g.105259  ORF Transcript_36603/g.105259 Transcript_36603/m.105259 type:complete len:235 (-) Transcript_36603:1667-2371(-)
MLPGEPKVRRRTKDNSESMSSCCCSNVSNRSRTLATTRPKLPSGCVCAAVPLAFGAELRLLGERDLAFRVGVRGSPSASNASPGALLCESYKLLSAVWAACASSSPGCPASAAAPASSTAKSHGLCHRSGGMLLERSNAADGEAGLNGGDTSALGAASSRLEGVSALGRLLRRDGGRVPVSTSSSRRARVSSTLSTMHTMSYCNMKERTLPLQPKIRTTLSSTSSMEKLGQSSE